jgi:hypothetical protein
MQGTRKIGRKVEEVGANSVEMILEKLMILKDPLGSE